MGIRFCHESLITETASEFKPVCSVRLCSILPLDTRFAFITRSVSEGELPVACFCSSALAHASGYFLSCMTRPLFPHQRR